MLEKVKTALRNQNDSLRLRDNRPYQAALKDLEIAGVSNKNLDDPLIGRAVITYCAVYLTRAPKWNERRRPTRRTESPDADGNRVRTAGGGRAVKMKNEY